MLYLMICLMFISTLAKSSDDDFLLDVEEDDFEFEDDFEDESYLDDLVDEFELFDDDDFNLIKVAKKVGKKIVKGAKSLLGIRRHKHFYSHLFGHGYGYSGAYFSADRYPFIYNHPMYKWY
ncbi:hypothetical protein EIN_186040 [Entamoeba invadens IP1]|uniref:hypothetical protein n=1 Tax=Entamoeba invadens IP1 TaxID=370355 RepID=UPI0002C3DF1F|nr:hypothetical protein EIN_186040 [Entamoeba invadens IP1]ELP94187.1 hypothetical protein EIN_186040 [Entamoeba invadens IP1]|eukprot:XP_004260958.1 hypothetical protein EIN_186040 [Entamoeba invadens IP1]